MDFGVILQNLWEQSGFAAATWQNFVMIGVAIVFLVLAIKFKFEQQQFTRGAPLIFSRAPKNYLCIFAQNSRMFIEPVSTKIAL